MWVVGLLKASSVVGNVALIPPLTLQVLNPVSKRILSPYELTQLARYGFSPDDLLSRGEIPVEYLTGYVDFCDLTFQVSPVVLIPRVETEELVEIALQETKKLHNKLRKPIVIADIGTGSGAIAISLAKRLEKEKVPHQMWASDVYSDALEIAQKNAKLLNAKVSFLHGSLLEPILNEKVKLDLIVANLPYIPSSRLQTLESSVTDFEPTGALDGGEDGLDKLNELVSQCRGYDCVKTIVLEVDDTHTEKTVAHCSKFWNIIPSTDFAKKQRFLTLRRK